MRIKKLYKNSETSFGILRGSVSSDWGFMAWSKVQTSTIGFAWGEANSYQVTSLDQNKQALAEWVGWLVSRGWVIEEQDVAATGVGTVYWAITKEYVTIEGGTREIGWWIEYIGDTSSYDQLNIYGYDKVTGQKHSSSTENLRYEEELHGIWTMWVSDQDNDSFLIINQTNGKVIGFMPPSGSLFNYTAGFNTTFPVAKGLLPLFAEQPCFESTSLYQLDVGFGYSSVPSQLVSPIPYKFDYVIGTISNSNPLFNVNGGDMSSMLNLSIGSTVQYGTTQGVATLLLDGEYYIAWGVESQLLFNVGTNAPVY